VRPRELTLGLALAAAETVAARLQKERPASTATIEALDAKT
jgi:hypothetical protein